MRRKLLLTVKGLVLAVFLVLVIAHAWGIAHSIHGSFHLIGNKDRHVKMLPAATDGKFRFAVMGDPEDGIEVFKELLGKANNNGCQFIILCGDLVHGDEEWRYRYLLHEAAEEKFRNPMFALIGNHDDYQNFRAYFGPENFFFRHANVLFILMDNAVRDPTPEQIRWLEDVLEKNRKEVRHAFLFFHCPLVHIAKGSDEEVRPIPTAAPLLRLIQKYSITRVFAGHLHSYRRVKIEGVDHVITGGAGATLQEPGVFHHYVQVDVEGDSVKDYLVRCEDLSSLGETLERKLVGEVYFNLQTRPILYLPVVFFFVLAIVILKRCSASGRADGSPPPVDVSQK